MGRGYFYRQARVLSPAPGTLVDQVVTYRCPFTCKAAGAVTSTQTRRDSFSLRHSVSKSSFKLLNLMTCWSSLKTSQKRTSNKKQMKVTRV